MKDRVENENDFDEVEFSIDFATAANMMLDHMSYDEARAADIEEWNEYKGITR